MRLKYSKINCQIMKFKGAYVNLNVRVVKLNFAIMKLYNRIKFYDGVMSVSINQKFINRDLYQ